MKKYPWISMVAFATLLLGCKDEKPQPKVIYESTEKAPKTEAKKGDKLTLVDLPIQFEGTDVLLFPVGEVVMNEEKLSKYESSSYEESTNFTVANTNEFEIAGNLSNIKFQVKPSDSLVSLTTQPIHIDRVSYLHAVAPLVKKQLLIYEVEDADTNQDGQINGNDIHSLYISTLEGKQFQKISPDLQEVIGWNVIEGRKQLYFRAIEDLNKNGAFDKEDKVHYYRVDLSVLPVQPQEFDPLN
jgi:hypothetical protein